MALANLSIATINSPEFINLQPLDINPLMSSCDIKVFYVGENRNGSYITKQVATEISKTLRGVPIVGYYKKDKQDFADHGDQIIWDDEGVHFNCLTRPYGFVSPDAKVWFQDFQDTDQFGNKIVRTYLMTTGFLWTEQFKQAKQVLEQDGKPQSMELDEKTLQGHWAKNIKNEMEFFIINDAIFSKLCILGDDVEPCFEGASITKPGISSTFNLDKDFTKTLYSMMEDLRVALEKGGPEMAKSELNTPEEVKDTSIIESTFAKKEDEEKENTSGAQQESEDKEDEDDKKKKEYAAEDDKKEKEEKQDTSKDDKDDEEDDTKKKYAALQADYDALSAQYTSLSEEVTSLRAFKKNIEDKEKDELISQFFMLTDEDKKDVMENKSTYTLDQIKAKLAVICFEKKVNFSLDDSSEKEEKQDVVTTFSVVDTEDSKPEWVKAVEQRMNKF